jgi:hypothetical protein
MRGRVGIPRIPACFSLAVLFRPAHPTHPSRAHTRLSRGRQPTWPLASSFLTAYSCFLALLHFPFAFEETQPQGYGLIYVSEFLVWEILLGLPHVHTNLSLTLNLMLYTPLCAFDEPSMSSATVMHLGKTLPCNYGNI